jgi:hypothetical protein
MATGGSGGIQDLQRWHGKRAGDRDVSNCFTHLELQQGSVMDKLGDWTFCEETSDEK